MSRENIKGVFAIESKVKYNMNSDLAFAEPKSRQV